GQIGFETGRLLQATFIFLGFRSNLRFAGDASYSPKKSVCCTRTFCSCYGWSSILFLLWVLPGFYSCCVSNKHLSCHLFKSLLNQWLRVFRGKWGGARGGIRYLMPR